MDHWLLVSNEVVTFSFFIQVFCCCCCCFLLFFWFVAKEGLAVFTKEATVMQLLGLLNLKLSFWFLELSSLDHFINHNFSIEKVKYLGSVLARLWITKAESKQIGTCHRGDMFPASSRGREDVVKMSFTQQQKGSYFNKNLIIGSPPTCCSRRTGFVVLLPNRKYKNWEATNLLLEAYTHSSVTN